MLNMTTRAALFVFVLMSPAFFPLVAEDKSSPKPTPSGEMMQKAMHEIRLKVLATPPSKIGRASTEEYPHVDTIIMDWPIQNTILSVMGSSAGDGSIYTTGSFGLLGGVKYETVRDAAKKFVKAGEKYYSDATPTQVFPYPQAGHVRFYLICYDGVRTIDTDAASLETGKGKYSDLFAEGQKEINALRQAAQAAGK